MTKLTVDHKELEEVKFRNRDHLLGYILDNESLLSLGDNSHSKPKIIGVNVPCGDADGSNIDLIVKYNASDYAIVIATDGCISDSTVKTLKQRLDQRSSPNVINVIKEEQPNVIIPDIRWKAVIIGTTIEADILQDFVDDKTIKTTDDTVIQLGTIVFHRLRDAVGGHEYLIRDIFFSTEITSYEKC